MKKLLFLLASGVGIVVAAGYGWAGRVEADPRKEYVVSPAAGPWMICAASYIGPNSSQLARQVVLQLRQRDHLPAYLFNRAEEERRKQQEHLEQTRQKYQLATEQRLPKVRIEDQFAVLVGGYPDIDTARRALGDVKKLKPPEFNLSSDVVPFDTTVDPATGQRLAINPFASSFVTRNPSMAHEKVDREKPDPFWKELNANESYSLLKCRRPWTLAVLEFQGATAIQPRSATGAFFEKLGLGGQPGAVLNASALQAHEVARVLREWKFDAYVLHTRRSSVVTVGGYDSPDDLRLQQAQRQLANLQLVPTIQLFAQPLPMRVPQL